MDNSTRMKIIQWSAYLNYHQYYTWQQVEALLGTRITHVVDGYEHDVLQGLGWRPIDAQDVIFIGLGKGEIISKGLHLLRENPEAVHVFQGIWGKREHLILILYALWHGIKVVIMSEPYSESAVGYFKEEPQLVSYIKVILRPVVYRCVSTLFRLAAQHTQPCILAISPIAQAQLVRNGFNNELVFNFGYFIPKQKSHFTIQSTLNSSRAVRLVFLGSLLRRKGLDLGIEAVKRVNLTGIKMTLDIYGSGKLDGFNDLEASGIHYGGLIPWENVQTILPEYDALLLPSRHDGWGLVVNEALLQDVPVILSDRVGAGCLVLYSGAGIIFKNGNVDELVRVLMELYANPKQLKCLKRKANEFVKETILPETGARYFVDVVRFHFWNLGSKPALPW